MAVMVGQCRCENSELSDFWRLVNPYGQNEFWGICCKRRSCNSEYLIERFTNNAAEIDVTVCGISLYLKSASDFVTDPDFQADPNRERITGENFTSVQRGDHVGFERIPGYWHHAIVEKVGRQSLIVIGWGGNFSNLSISQEILAGSNLNGMWKFRYSSEEEEQNPADLVIARAKSRLSQSQSGSFKLFVWDELNEGYGLFNQNCETLALYCKLGFTSTQLDVLIFRQRVAASRQLPWLVSTVCDITVKALCLTSGKLIAAFVKLIPTAFAPLLSAETLENVLQFLKNHESYFKVIGFSVVVITEVISLYKCKQKIDTRREQNPENNEALDQEFQEKCIESLLTIGFCGFMGAVMFDSNASLSVEIILNLTVLVLCKMLLPKLISKFIKWLENDSTSVLVFPHILRQPMVT